MGDWIKVDFDTVARAAERTSNAHTTIDRMQPVWEAATIPVGSLGRLGESEQLEAAIRERHEGLGVALEDLRKFLDQVQERLYTSVEQYEEYENSVIAILERAAGAIR